MMKYFVDLHCHPSLKPYGQNFETDKSNGKNPTNVNSIFYYDPPNVCDKILNITCTLSRFRQSDFTSLHKANVKVIGASLYPIERGFFAGRLGKGKWPDAIANFVTQVGHKRVDMIQSIYDYFKDLQDEYEFYVNLNNQDVIVNGETLRYNLVKNYNEISHNLTNTAENTLSVVLTIEGGHVFNSRANQRAEVDDILQNIKMIKEWEFRPLFISLGHHFYNELCGHEGSLSKLLEKLLDQSYGQGTGFTHLGEEVLTTVLDNSGGKRILIDVKHMSINSRKYYYQYLDERSEEKIPIVVSHGAVNGKPSYLNPDVGQTENSQQFYGESINFYDDEIVRIARSHGIFCIQLDERRLSQKHKSCLPDLQLSKTKMLFKNAGLVWNQIRHIAEVLDNVNEESWKYTAIGSDYDGIVDPLNGYWTAEQYGVLEHYLLKHAESYMLHKGKNLKMKANREIEPHTIINNVMCNNALEFLKEQFV
jgi:microsomal dipeptidase-like Zn-dependent dipeptidase